MPIYESKEYNADKLFELRRTQICKECGGFLNLFRGADGKVFLACNDFHRSHHEGIAKEAKLYEPNIPTRREEMEKELGKGKATALMPYAQSILKTEDDAMKVLRTIWPEAPKEEMTKAAMVCVQYELNPLMRHLFLIPFKTKDGGKKWATVLGIQANRLIAHRAGNFSYLDDTPRVMTKEEQERIFGEVHTDRIWAITKLKDNKGNEAAGYGFWMKAENPYGAEKGNTKANMAFIRSERQAMDRLFAGKLPEQVEVMDERYVETQNGRGLDTVTGEIVEESVAETAVADEPEPVSDEPSEEAPIDPEWLIESVNTLNWNLLSYIKDTDQVIAQGRESLLDVVKKLTPDQRRSLVKEIEDRLKMM